MKTWTKRILPWILSGLLLLSAAGCSDEQADTSVTDTSAAVETTDTAEPETEETAPESEETETEPEETEAETLPNEAELVEEPSSEITGYSDDPRDESAPAAETTEEISAETEPAETEPAEPERIYNYLNGATVTEEEQNKRPVAIMVNNIKNSLPQEGICEGDIYYECAAEGGITRIMMLVSDYASLPTVGSIRSSRDYFVDFIQSHDALYVHAGGSNQAYEKILGWDVDNLDGVNMYLPTTFWRDEWRWANMGYEHSMMTNGEAIVDGIEYKGYRTELAEDQVPMFQFYDEDVDNQLVGSVATHVHMQSTSIQTVDFVYDEATGEYLRYQYNGMAHVDGTTGEQLSVKNLLILFTDISVIPGDEAGRLSVGTVGSGQGYYITNGKRKVVNWSRENQTATMHIEYRNGDELILNSGKTFICVVDDSVAKNIVFDYEW